MNEFIESVLLIWMLLNPFLIIVYLIEPVQRFDLKTFIKILFRGALISIGAFIVFTVMGDILFYKLLKVEFDSFRIFGGIIFLIVGIEFILKGNIAIDDLRGELDKIAGAIAMPVMIGPGTISASVIIGKKLPKLEAILAVITAVFLSIIVIVILKIIHDKVKPRKEYLVERYIEIAGRVTALYIGTFSVDMIMKGLKGWICKF